MEGRMRDGQPTEPVRSRPATALLLAAPLAAGGLLAAWGEHVFAAPSPPAPLARDEAFVVRLARPTSLFAFVDAARLAARGGVEPNGLFVSGRPLLDRATGRQVVVRPEALREYYEIVRGLSREDADIAAAKVLSRVEKTGNVSLLEPVDAALRQMFGPTAGTRLDDPAVLAFVPPYGVTDAAGAALRTVVAGDDTLWHAYVFGDINAFETLATNPGYERFVHPIDPATGVPSAESVLRQREHRRVLMRRDRTSVTFLPDVPMRASLTDAAYLAGTTYELSVARRYGAGAMSLTPERGGVVRFVHRLATFTVAGDPGDGGPFLGGLQDASTGTSVGATVAPRVVNMTPPPGESFVDPTTDWEDPDDEYLVPVAARRMFVIRLRFARPLDPRTVDEAHFTLTKTATYDAAGNETAISVPAAIGVTLFQLRMGEVVVDVQPVRSLDPQSKYRLDVLGTVRGLDGTPMGAAFSADLR
jgi:hypothetical protein